MASGRIVLLNGPSSAGKTTLAQAVARRLATPWLVLPVDLFHQIRTRPDADLTDRQWHDVFHRTRAAYHRALVGAASSGMRRARRPRAQRAVAPRRPAPADRGPRRAAGARHCSPKELRRREKQRGDRDPGTALHQQRLVFQHGDCDLTVDTTYGPDEPTAALLELIRNPPTERAFDRLRARRAARA